MRVHANLINQIAIVRERAETLHRSVTDHFRPDSAIALSLVAMITKYQAIEADLRSSAARPTHPQLTLMELSGIAEELSQRLGTVIVLVDGLPRIFSRTNASRPS